MVTLRELTGSLPEVSDGNVLPADILDRDVTWVTRPRPSPPAFAHLSGGELVLLRHEDLIDVDDRLTLDVAIRQLARFGITAVAFAGAITAADRALAQARDVALIALPPDVDLEAIELRAGQVIAERRRERQRKGHESGRRLMELAIAGEPLATVITALSELSSQAVALEGRDGRMLTYFGGTGHPARDVVEPLLDATRGVVGNWLAVTSDASPAEPPTMHMALGPDLDRTVAPVIGRDGLLGCLSLIGPTSAWSGDDGLLTSRGAAACAIVLAREFASIAARREIELNVLDEVLDGALRNEVTLLQQARRLGYDLAAPNRIVVFRYAGVDAATLRSQIGIALGSIAAPALWRIKEGDLELVAVVGADDAVTVTALRNAAPGTPLLAGAGQDYAGLAGLQRSRNEARQALMIRQRLGMTEPVARFGDLGIYRLLFAAEPLPEFAEFHETMLGTLVVHDARHNSDFLPTLAAFFGANGSPKEAAARLGVHRNTILYRLGRIAALTGYDLDDADTRLRLHLALSIHTITSSTADGRSAA